MEVAPARLQVTRWRNLTEAGTTARTRLFSKTTPVEGFSKRGYCADRSLGERNSTMNPNIKTLLVAGVSLLLAGCDYTVPLVTKPEIQIDRNVLGLWQDTDPENPSQQLLVLPLGPREYLISFPHVSRDGLFARAALVRCAGRTLVQLEWLGTARGGVPDDNRVYQFAAYALKGDRLEVRLLRLEVVSKDVSSTAELIRAIEANKDRPDLFREPMVFRQVKE
jgi:hypothetical protein